MHAGIWIVKVMNTAGTLFNICRFKWVDYCTLHKKVGQNISSSFCPKLARPNAVLWNAIPFCRPNLASKSAHYLLKEGLFYNILLFFIKYVKKCWEITAKLAILTRCWVRQVCLVGAHIAKSELLQNSLTFIKTLTKITVYLIIDTSIGNMIL